MTASLARLALGLAIGLVGVLPATAQTKTDTTKTDTTAPAVTTTTAPAADPAAPAAPADGVSMGVPDGLPDQAHAELGKVYIAASFDAWEQRCVKTADGSDPCQLYQLLKDSTGNPIAEISFFTLPDGGQAAAGATIMLPLETLLTANLRIAVDQAVAKLYPFSYCTVSGCLAKVGFTGDELTAMQKGTNASLTIVPAAAPDKTVVVAVALKGFTAGYKAIKDAQAKVKK